MFGAVRGELDLTETWEFYASAADAIAGLYENTGYANADWHASTNRKESLRTRKSNRRQNSPALTSNHSWTDCSRFKSPTSSLSTKKKCNCSNKWLDQKLRRTRIQGAIAGCEKAC